MEFAISILKEYPKWDSLSVIKLTAFPYEKEGFKPFSQARICFVQDKGMYARLWAFDVDPITASTPQTLFEGNALVLQLAPGQDASAPYLEIAANAGGVFTFCTARGQTTLTQGAPAGFTLKEFTGEDLQGEYWGWEVFVPLACFRSLDPSFSIQEHQPLRGNLLKVCLDARYKHIGSYNALTCPFGVLRSPQDFAPVVLAGY